jgi:hypothetical protein
MCGAMGIRTPDLLHAMRNSCVRLRRMVSDGEPPACASSPGPSQGVGGSLNTLAPIRGSPRASSGGQVRAECGHGCPAEDHNEPSAAAGRGSVPAAAGGHDAWLARRAPRTASASPPGASLSVHHGVDRRRLHMASPASVSEEWHNSHMCPVCRGSDRVPIAPGFWRCAAQRRVETGGPGLVNPAAGPPVLVSYVTCNAEYQDGPVYGTPQVCGCGTFAIGMCAECSTPVCGLHSAMLEERRLCSADYEKRSAVISAAKRVAERKAMEEAARRTASRPKTPARLNAAGVAKVDISGHIAEYVTKKHLFGREERRWDSMHFRRIGSGWLVGELGWDHPERGNMGAGTMTLTTAVVDTSDWDSPGNTNRGCVPVRREGAAYLLMASDFHLSSGIELMLSDRILRLPGE